MKWILMTHDYPPKRGGVARYLEALKKTCPCILVEKLDRLPNRLSLAWGVYKNMNRADGMITSHVLPIGTMCWLMSRFLNKPYVVILHGMDFDLARRNIWKRFLLKRILKSAYKIITNTKALDREVSTFVHRMDIEVVYPTVTDGFVEASHFIHAKHKASRQMRLLTVSRLVERKGHIKVLRALRNDQDLQYTIIGDGPYKSDIKNYIEKHGLEERVELLSNISDRKLPDVYAKSDVFVMPTKKSKEDREGFGIVYLEAQLFQVPVIATDHPGVDEALLNNKTGYLIKDSDRALRRSIQRLKDASVRKQMGKEGGRFVKKHFTREQQCSHFCKLLDCE